MKKMLTGTVVSAGRDKTLRVNIERRFRHPKYGKIIRRRKGCQVHDPENSASEGDVVEIEECPPVSRSKRWVLRRIVETARVG